MSAPVQQKAATSAPASEIPAGPRRTLDDLFPGVQRKAGGAEPDTAAIHASAQRGVATAISPLPHAATIQRLFGRHDISGIQAHTGPDAIASTREMGADAYATGNHVVLGAGTDLHTVAHEAAHVVQQRGGVQLKGGVGDAGDAYEQHADEVADAVASGESAEELLDAGPGEHAPEETEADETTEDTSAEASAEATEDASADASADTAASEDDAAIEDAHADATEIEAAGVEGSAEPMHDEAGLNEHAGAAPAAASHPGAAPVASPAVQMVHAKGGRGRRGPRRTRPRRDALVDHGRIRKPHRRGRNRAQPRGTVLLQLSRLRGDALIARVATMSRRQCNSLLRSITPKERRQHADLIAKIQQLRVARQARRLEGDFHWSGPSHPNRRGKIDTCGGKNQFAIWIRHGTAPTSTQGMNCWEMVLYSAYVSGVVSKGWIKKIHLRAREAYRSESDHGEKQEAYYNVLSNALGYLRATLVEDDVAVPEGHIVFFDGIKHVAISSGPLDDEGQHPIMSLWCVPRRDDSVQHTTIERLIQSAKDSGEKRPEVKHAPPPWR